MRIGAVQRGAAHVAVLILFGIAGACEVQTEILACNPGTMVLCPYLGPPDTDGIGVCRPGLARCGEDGALGPCEGEIGPTAESCGTPGDDDCDGHVNEEGSDCACEPGEIRSCYGGPPEKMDVGACRSGLQVCRADGLGFDDCEGDIAPAAAEDCSTPDDDDCDLATSCVCPPGATQSCYSGPVGTEGVGICGAGTRVCNADGLGWGDCTGESLPEIERCDTFTDESCDGDAYCTGNHLWSARFGDASEQNSVGVDTDAAGNVVLVGRMSGSIDLGGGPMSSAGEYDGFVAKFDPTGQPVWSKLFGGPGNQWAQRVAIDGQGNVIIAGDMDAKASFGGGNCPAIDTPGSGYDIFVAKFSSDGACQWDRGFGGPDEQRVEEVAVDSQGNILLVGHSKGNLKFGATPELVNAGGFDVFIAKLDPQGNAVWSKGVGDGPDQLGIGIAADAQGDVFVTGQFAGTVNFSGGAPLQSAGGDDVFVAKLDSTGAHIWSKAFGGPGQDSGYAVAPDDLGGVFVVGPFGGQLDFGGPPLTSAGSQDIFVAKLDAVQGNHIWSQRFGDAQEQGVRRVRSNSVGDVVVCGDYYGTVDFGGGPLVSADSRDGFVAKFSGSGAHLWSRRMGSAGYEYVQGLAIDPLGNVLTAGSFQLAVDFGDGVLQSQGSYDAFVAKLSP